MGRVFRAVGIFALALLLLGAPSFARADFASTYTDIEATRKFFDVSAIVDGSPVVSGEPVELILGEEVILRMEYTANPPTSYEPYSGFPLDFEAVRTGGRGTFMVFKGVPGQSENNMIATRDYGTVSFETPYTFTEPGHYFIVVAPNYFIGWPPPGLSVFEICGDPPTPGCSVPQPNLARFVNFLTTGIQYDGSPPGQGDLYPMMYGIIEFDVVQPAPEPECCSSVLFLPGIKGSVLRDGDNPQNKLWPPTAWADDIEALALTEEGESANPIIVDGILSDFYGAAVYGPFASYLDNLVEDHVLQEWLPVPYDWRFSPEEILAEGVQTEGGIVDIVAEAEELASRSPTEKITVVAHSMGGLVGKALIQELESRGRAGIIDSFVMVGSPQLGTPQGIASLLHGDEEGIAGGVIVDATDVRIVGQNMQSAYNLMPSPQYFEEIEDPVFVFSEQSSFTEPWRTYFGTATTTTYDEFENFVVNRDQFREYPDPAELLVPEVLRENLVDTAEAFHNLYDPYQVPDSVNVVQIAGWGIQTLKGITYLTEEGQQAYQARFTREGDKTVVYPSAISSVADKTYYLNLDLFTTQERQEASHKDLLNLDSVQVLLTSIFEQQGEILGDYITLQKPTTTNLEDQLLVSTHSPVLLGVEDNLGNFTGINSSQIGNEFLAIEEGIPGSTFLVLGGDNYVFLPKEGEYTFSFKGTGTGSATVKKAVVSGDTTTTLATYTDIPVTPETEATFTVAEPIEDTLINVDLDGDGQIDTTVVPDGYVAPPTLEELIASLRTEIETLAVKPKLKEKLLKKIERLEKRIAKDKLERASKTVMNLEKKITKKTTKRKITDTEAETLLKLLDAIEEAL